MSSSSKKVWHEIQLPRDSPTSKNSDVKIQHMIKVPVMIIQSFKYKIKIKQQEGILAMESNTTSIKILKDFFF